MPTKICTVCKVEKDYSCFSRASSNKGGVYSICRECVNDKRLSNKTRKYREEKQTLLREGRKKCAKCGSIKEISLFHKDKCRRDGVKPYCKDCLNEMSREHDSRLDVKQRRHERDKLPIVKENRKIYRQDSPKFKATQEKYEKSEKRIEGRRKYAQRDQVRVERRLRSRVYEALTLGHAERKMEFWELVGCSVEFFMEYIESLWTEGMTWGNYTHKGWHLDHIRPCASFDLRDEEQQKQCFHYTNYQPLWGKENFSKNSIYNGVRYFRKSNS